MGTANIAFDKKILPLSQRLRRNEKNVDAKCFARGIWKVKVMSQLGNAEAGKDGSKRISDRRNKIILGENLVIFGNYFKEIAIKRS